MAFSLRFAAILFVSTFSTARRADLRRQRNPFVQPRPTPLKCLSQCVGFYYKLRGFWEPSLVAADAADQVARRWEPRIDGAGTEAEAALLQEQADADMVDAINGIDNMTVEDYHAIYVAAQADPDLATLLIELFRERSEP